MRRLGLDYDDIAGTRDHQLPVDGRFHLAGVNDAGFTVRMRVHARSLSRLEVANKERDVGIVQPAFELHGRNGTPLLFAAMQNVEHHCSTERHPMLAAIVSPAHPWMLLKLAPHLCLPPLISYSIRSRLRSPPSAFTR